MSDGNENNRWDDGWAFYKGNGKTARFLPPPSGCCEWIKGYCAALADYDLESWQIHPSIQAALVHHGIDGDLLEACLLSAEAVIASEEWCRWPSVPVREWSAANDEMC
jgi:hypothetical protein